MTRLIHFRGCIFPSSEIKRIGDVTKSLEYRDGSFDFRFVFYLKDGEEFWWCSAKCASGSPESIEEQREKADRARAALIDYAWPQAATMDM